MLSKDQIIDLVLGTPEWDIFWSGKISSSQVSTIVTKDELEDSARKYLIYKAMERFCNVKKSTVREEINEEDDVAWGIKYEPDALNRFCEINSCDNLIRHKVVNSLDGISATMPDGLFLHEHENAYIGLTVEAKCPKQYPRYYAALSCVTPEDVKKFDRRHYWQVVDQMLTCSAYIGYLIYYHPHFPKEINYNIIEFKRTDIFDDFILLDTRKKESALIMQGYIDNVCSIRSNRMKQ